MKTRLRRAGLTLLELMIVLIILVGLLAIVGPRLLGTQKKADIKTTQAQIGSFEGALKMYSVDMKTYPDSEDGLSGLLKAPDDERRAKMWDGPYLDEEKLPLDPWGNEYQYEFDPASGDSKPRIFSAGPDGENDTEDDIANRGKSGEGDDSSDSSGGSEEDSSDF